MAAYKPDGPGVTENATRAMPQLPGSRLDKLSWKLSQLPFHSGRRRQSDRDGTVIKGLEANQPDTYARLCLGQDASTMKVKQGELVWGQVTSCSDWWPCQVVSTADCSLDAEALSRQLPNHALVCFYGSRKAG
jgi:hypothetical protein